MPETTSYSYDTLGNIAQFACDLGDQDAVVETLDNFTDIRAEDRATVARLALTYACR